MKPEAPTFSILATPPALAAIDEQQQSAEKAPPSAIEPHATEQRTRWGLAKRLGFRFAFGYFVLYAFPFPIGFLPGTEGLSSAYQRNWQVLVSWVAKDVLHVGYQFSNAPNGSGDKTYDWVLTFCLLALAMVIAALWSVLDRNRPNYDRLHQWLRLYLRLYVGTFLITYGSYKIIQSQFPPPNLSRLAETYGDSSPMGLLWTFMGASHAYNVFAGAAEMLGGVLLIIPALVTLGALLSLAVAGNVFILNMAYDVPVKLFSFHLMVMAAFITLPDANRLTNLFILNRRAEPVVVRPLFRRRILNRGLLCLQLVLIAVIGGLSLFQSWQTTDYFEKFAVEPTLRGIWSVDEFTVDSQVSPPSMRNANRWQRVVLEYNYRLSVQFMDAPQQPYSMDLNMSAGTLELTIPENPNWKATLNYETPQPGILVFKGKMDGHQVQITMHRKELSKFQLTNRGFHWISEFPFNR